MVLLSFVEVHRSWSEIANQSQAGGIVLLMSITLVNVLLMSFPPMHSVFPRSSLRLLVLVEKKANVKGMTNSEISEFAIAVCPPSSVVLLFTRLHIHSRLRCRGEAVGRGLQVLLLIF